MLFLWITILNYLLGIQVSNFLWNGVFYANFLPELLSNSLKFSFLYYYLVLHFYYIYQLFPDHTFIWTYTCFRNSRVSILPINIPFAKVTSKWGGMPKLKRLIRLQGRAKVSCFLEARVNSFLQINIMSTSRPEEEEKRSEM